MRGALPQPPSRLLCRRSPTGSTAGGDGEDEAELASPNSVKELTNGTKSTLNISTREMDKYDQRVSRRHPPPHRPARVPGPWRGPSSLIRRASCAILQLDEETLSDLTWAFIATDLNHSGTIDAKEMSAILCVLAGKLHAKKNNRVPGSDRKWSRKSIQEIMKNAKDEFKRFRIDNNLEDLPNEYQYPDAVDPNAPDIARETSEEVLFEVEGESKAAAKRHKKLAERYGHSHRDGDPALTKFFSTAGKDVLKMSKKVVKGSVELGVDAIKGTTVGLAQVVGLIEKAGPDELHFAEFVHMLQSGQLDELFPDHDWKKSCHEIHGLRRAFDTADVDGDNQLEQGEFELVVDTLHMGHDLEPTDIDYCWEVLVSATREEDADHPNHLNFIEFIVGVQHLKDDERMAGRLDLTKENPWNMLSLLIDTPVSELEEERLTSKLNFLERIGLAMVKGAQYPMHRDKIRSILKECVNGNLRQLNNGKRERLALVWRHCVIQAMIIGFIACGISSPAENLFVYWFRNDGLVDIDCVCYTRGCMFNAGSLGIADADLAPGDTTIPGAFVDLFKTSVVFQNNDPCNTAEMYNLPDYASDASVPYSCTFRDHLNWEESLGEDSSVSEYCDVGACQPGPGGWNEPAEQVDPADGKTPIDQPAWEAARNCSARRNTTCGFVDAWSMGSYLPGINPETGKYYGQGDDAPDQCWTNVWAATWFWITCLSVVILCCVVEIALLMYYGVYHSMRIAWALGYRLSPLNEDRAFLADSLVRGAFELGNPENPLYGVDPTAEVGEATRWRIALVITLWKGKIALTAAIMKFIYGCIFPWHTAVWVKPWLSMPSDMFWNAMTAHIVISQAQIRGVGVATAHEVFNEIMDYGNFRQREMRDMHKLQTARAIGVAIVKHGNLYPTMEVLLRHGISWMKMQSNPAVLKGGILDDPDGFLENMELLERDEKIAVISMHLLCIVLDGNANSRTRESFKDALAVRARAPPSLLLLHQRPRLLLPSLLFLHTTDLADRLVTRSLISIDI